MIFSEPGLFATQEVIPESTAALALNPISPSSCNVHMFICAAGDIHGAMNRLYDDILAFESALGVRFDYVLHVGDFGVWPDPNRMDKATREHDGAGDFPIWFAENRAAPLPTVFIKSATVRPTTSVGQPRGARRAGAGPWLRDLR